MKIRNQISMAVLSGLGFIGMAVAADQAQVATLVRIDGAAIASQDAKYVPAREGMTLKEGDRLMVLEGGSAILAFADGCQYELGEMAMLAVQGISTCAAKGVGVYKVDPRSGVADGAVPQAQLAAIGNKKARSKAQCDAATKNANPKDDCDCEERRNNDDKDDDCPPVALLPGATGGGAGGVLAGTTGAMVFGGAAVVGLAAVAVASNNNDNDNNLGPISAQ
ncbi:MAG: hypothetical protein WBJ41_18300 [Chromatiaceae bacterium]